MRFDVLSGSGRPGHLIDEIEAGDRASARRQFRERRIKRGYPASARLVHIDDDDPGPPRARYRPHGARARVRARNPAKLGGVGSFLLAATALIVVLMIGKKLTTPATLPGASP